MTEAEAATKRCCGPEGCGGNSAGEKERFCIASACMAWRKDPNDKQGGGMCGLAGVVVFRT